MPKYKVKLEDGRTARIETEQPVESNEQMQQIIAQQMGGVQKTEQNVANNEQYLSPIERLSTGFKVNPEEAIALEVSKRGLKQGTPLEPTPLTASLMANIKDIPNDLLDMVGPAFPAIGQIVGGALAGIASIPTTGGTAAPAAVVAGGVGGAMGGEVLRQGIGEFFNLEDKGFSDRAKKVALEGAFGLAGEAAYLGGSALLNATKKGLVKAGEKLLSQKGLEGFVKGFGKITRNLGVDEFYHALKSLKAGDDSVLKSKFASVDFGDNFSKELFFGEKIVNGKVVKIGDISRQIRNLASRKEAREPVKQLYKEYFGLSDETLDMAIKYGKNLKRFDNKSVINSIKQINKKLPQMFDDVGKRLGKARNDLASRVPGADVSQELSAVNRMLGDELAEVGLLKKVSEGVYEINSTYSVTSQGKAQVGSFLNFIDNFFSKTKDIGSSNMVRLKEAILRGDSEAITKITRGKYFTNQVNSTFGQFSKSMKSLDKQISGREFQQLGQLSPTLTKYIQGLRGISAKVADEYGDINVKALTKEYRNLVQNADLLRNGSKVKSVDELSRVLSKYINPKDVIEQEQAKALDSFLRKQVGSNVFENVRGFKSYNQLKAVETDITKSQGRQNFVNMLKSAFNENTSVKRDLIENNIDPFLPKNLKIGINARNHTTATALQQDALSILKARFLSSGLGVPALVGGATGGALGGYKGATVGLVAGVGLQNPKILQYLLKTAAKAPAKRSLNIPIRGATRGQTIGGMQTLRGLINQTSR